MIDLLILFSILKKELTMYGIQKNISDIFSAYTMPSFGALNPALKKMELKGFITSRKSMSDGGKQSCFYSIKPEGVKELKRLLLEDMSKNPLQFFSNARIKLSCASFLSKDEATELFSQLKMKATDHKYNAEKTLENEYISLTFYQRIVLDNSVCEYKNLISLIENLEKENARNS